MLTFIECLRFNVSSGNQIKKGRPNTVLVALHYLESGFLDMSIFSTKEIVGNNRTETQYVANEQRKNNDNK